MPTLWIHRSSASDILVQFSEQRREDAIQFAHRLLRETSDDCVTETGAMDSDGLVALGYSTSMQIILASSDEFHPDNYRLDARPNATWNQRGFVQVAEDEARDLGLTGEPEGFVPYSNQNIWKSRYKTADELTAELDAYYAAATATAQASS
jgi:hypothetical protein